MNPLDHAPSWFLVFLVACMGPIMAWMGAKYFGSLHKRLDIFDSKLEKLIETLVSYTPIAQHTGAYERVYAKLEALSERITRMEEHKNEAHSQIFAKIDALTDRTTRTEEHQK